jgi:hypothetical protein
VCDVLEFRTVLVFFALNQLLYTQQQQGLSGRATFFRTMQPASILSQRKTPLLSHQVHFCILNTEEDSTCLSTAKLTFASHFPVYQYKNRNPSDRVYTNTVYSVRNDLNRWLLSFLKGIELFLLLHIFY